MALPSKANLLGGIAGVASWLVVAGLESQGWLPYANAAATVIEATGLMPFMDGKDGIGPVVGTVVNLLVTHWAEKKWPSVAAVNAAIVKLGAVLPTTYPDYRISKNDPSGFKPDHQPKS